jgi:hypothetical protein
MLALYTSRLMLHVMQPLLASGAAEASGAEDTGETFTSTSFPQSVVSGGKQDEILKKKKVVPAVAISICATVRS